MSNGEKFDRTKLFVFKSTERLKFKVHYIRIFKNTR